MTVVFLNYNASSKQTGKKTKELYICYLNCAILTHDDQKLFTSKIPFIQANVLNYIYSDRKLMC